MDKQSFLVLCVFAPALILGPALTCISPPIMTPLFIAGAILGMLAYHIKYREKPVIDRRLGLLFGAFLTYGLVSTLWSINAGDTPGKAMTLAAMFMPVAMLIPLIRTLEEKALRLLGYCIGIGFALGSAIYLIELFGDYALWDLVRGGHSDDFVAFKQNKPAFLLAIWVYLLFPFFFMGTVKKLSYAFLATLPVIGYITFSADSSTSFLLLYIVPAIALFVRVMPVRVSLALTLAVTIFLAVSMPFLARLAYDHAPWRENMEALGSSVVSRIEIWNQASSRAFEKPIFGWGLDSASELPNREDQSILHADRPIAHLHPHNAPIQIWFELGAIGVAFVMALFVFFVRSIRGMTSIAAQRYAVFLWASVFLYTLSSWGIWQSWFVATLCFTGLVGSAGIRYLELTEKKGRP